MNSPDSGTVHTTGQKTRFSSAARALVVGLALVLPGAAALAIGEPIPGIDIVVKCLGCKPPIHGITAPTRSDGTYQFKELAPGNYDLSIDGQRVQTISVDKGTISGVLSREPDGKASITFNGQAAALGPAAAIVTTRDNLTGKGRDKPKGKAGVGGVDDAAPDGPQGVAVQDSGIKATGNVPTTRGRIGKPGTGAPNGDEPSLPGMAINDPIPGVDIIVKKNPRGIKVTLPSDASGKFSLRLQEAGNYTVSTVCRQPSCASHTITATYENVDYKCVRFGICFNLTVGQSGGILSGRIKLAENESPRPTNGGIRVEVGDVNGDGRTEMRTVSPTGHAPKPVSTGTGPHRSLKAGEPQPEDVRLGISDQAAAGGLISYSTAPLQKAGTGAIVVGQPFVPGGGTPGAAINTTHSGIKKPGIMGTPISDTPIGLEGDPEPISIGAATTDKNGAFHFDKLPAGKYKLVIAGQRMQTISVGTDSIASGTVMRGKDGELSIFDRWGNAVAASKDEDKKPGIAGPGDPIPGTDVGLDHDPGGPISTTKTDVNGAYQFTGLPAGKYKLTFPGLPAKSITIGTDGKTGGKVLRDGNNVIVTGDFEGSPARSKATANPVPGFLGGGFPGIGNVMGGILPGMSPGAGGPGAGPMSPAAGPMGPGGPAGPMGPGAGAIRR